MSFKPKVQVQNDESDNSDEEGEQQQPKQSRSRQKTTFFNYSKLGQPSVNAMITHKQKSFYARPEQHDLYKLWLQQLWTEGFITDIMIKNPQRFECTHPCHSYNDPFMMNTR